MPRLQVYLPDDLHDELKQSRLAASELLLSRWHLRAAGSSVRMHSTGPRPLWASSAAEVSTHHPPTHSR